MRYKGLYIILFTMLSIVPLLGQQQWYISIDERHPAERNELSDMRRVMVVNNALEQPKSFGHTTVLDGESKGGIEVDLGQSVLQCLFAVAQTLELSGEFDVVQLMEVSQNSSTNYYNRTPLKRAVAQRLCTEYEVDAILVLNQLVLYDVLESFPTDDGNYFAYLQAYAQSHWTVHYADYTYEKSFVYADTLLWESHTHYTRAQSLNQLPSRQEALLYMAQDLGNRMAQSLVPAWISARRYIYEDDDLEDGLSSFRYQRWQEAISKWQLCLEGSNKKAAALAAANIAIAYELLGDYASACDYGQRAIRLFSSAWKTAWGRQQQVNIRYYLEQLRARQVRERAQ